MLGRSVSTAIESRNPELYRRLAQRAGIDIEPAACWLLLRCDEHPDATIGTLADRLRLPASRLAPLADRLGTNRLIEFEPGDDSPDERLLLTDLGRSAVERLTAGRRDGLAELLDGWSPEQHPELAALRGRLAHDLLADDNRILQDAQPVSAR